MGKRWVGWDSVEVGGQLSIFYEASFINYGKTLRFISEVMQVIPEY